MKILIIDSHKGSLNTPQNMHWQNAKILADELGADLIWSYPTVNDNIKSDYDIIIFVHASHYAYTDYKWIENSPNAKLFYITNEYNLGEPRTLWMAAKTGRKYKVIANHDHKISKVVMKYTTSWSNVNLNALIYKPVVTSDSDRHGCIYYGSFRKGRSDSFKKYLNENVLLSTHSKNVSKFREAGATSEIVKRIDWAKDGLKNFKQSLYIEDEITHDNYNYLGNRFYEALNYNCLPVFSVECVNTVALSGYEINGENFISDSSQLKKVKAEIRQSWHLRAVQEKKECLDKIKSIIGI